MTRYRSVLEIRGENIGLSTNVRPYITCKKYFQIILEYLDPSKCNNALWWEY